LYFFLVLGFLPSSITTTSLQDLVDSSGTLMGDTTLWDLHWKMTWKYLSDMTHWICHMTHLPHHSFSQCNIGYNTLNRIFMTINAPCFLLAVITTSLNPQGFSIYHERLTAFWRNRFSFLYSFFATSWLGYEPLDCHIWEGKVAFLQWRR
jgi:hypothetical protein